MAIKKTLFLTIFYLSSSMVLTFEIAVDQKSLETMFLIAIQATNDNRKLCFLVHVFLI